MKELVCIVCPNGCRLQVDDEHGYTVTGNRCPRGAAYGKTECTHPTRVLTSTVAIAMIAYPIIFAIWKFFYVGFQYLPDVLLNYIPDVDELITLRRREGIYSSAQQLCQQIAQAIADKLGLELQVTDIAFDSIIPGVQTGKYDIGLAGMTVTDERLEQVNFTDSYATGIQVVIVGPNSSITSVDDLFAEGASHVVGTQTGTTGFIYATSDIQDAGLGEVKSFAKTTDAVEALKNGQVDCVILDNQPAQALVAANADAGLSILDTEYAVEDYAAAVSKDNAALTEAINGALKELIADGTVQTILDKYISE